MNLVTSRSADELHIRLIAAGTPEFEAVVALGKANSRYLGHFPRGAFEEYARNRHILGAITATGELAGYLLYRTNSTHAVIVHLCVDQRFRHRGIARRLFNELRATTSEFHGIILRCRRDFPANSLWPRLGLRAVTERPGRNAEGKPLTLWAFDHDHPNLFSGIGTEIEESRVLVALDTNIVFDLQDPPTEKSEESLALEADWLSGAFEFCVTTEVYNDINRANSSTERNRRRTFVRRFRELSGDPATADEAEANLRPLFSVPLSESTESDIRHLAKCVAAGVPIFLTRDEDVLALKEPIFELFGLTVMSPCELVIAHDERVRSAAYAPARLAGSLSAVQRVAQGDISAITDTFLSHRHGEKKGLLRRRLRRLLASPHSVEGNIIRDRSGKPLALYVLDRSDKKNIRLPVLRVLRCAFDQALLGHILWQTCIAARTEGGTRIDITDPCLPEGAEPTLSRLGYVQVRSGWRRLLLDCVASPDELSDRVRELVSEDSHVQEAFTPLLRMLNEAAANVCGADLARVERTLWPVKVRSNALPSFIVPIKPIWASRLFEERLAAETLFGADEDLALSVENVYYRAARPRVLSAPARVLWYVSRSSEYSGTMSIRAVSYVTSVTVGEAKELFRRYRRLGVYNWTDVRELAGGPTGYVMAFTFTDTELLPSPIPFTRVQEVLRKFTGSGHPLVSPVQIPNECFVQLYTEGTEGYGVVA